MFKDELVYIALYEGEIAGLSQLLLTDDEGELYTNYTGVHKSFRNRGIAKALKVMGIQEAIAYGADMVTTDSEENNGPMQHVNKQLGFIPGSGHYRIIKNLG